MEDLNQYESPLPTQKQRLISLSPLSDTPSQSPELSVFTSLPFGCKSLLTWLLTFISPCTKAIVGAGCQEMTTMPFRSQNPGRICVMWLQCNFTCRVLERKWYLSKANKSKGAYPISLFSPVFSSVTTICSWQVHASLIFRYNSSSYLLSVWLWNPRWQASEGH